MSDVKNNTIHLCNSCANRYPDCEAQEGVMFGDGQGQDNICCCDKYMPLIEHDYIRGGFTYN